MGACIMTHMYACMLTHVDACTMTHMGTCMMTQLSCDLSRFGADLSKAICKMMVHSTAPWGLAKATMNRPSCSITLHVCNRE